ncbi:hypothetical protein GH714_005949 [Hevea brasiliensis]|uniref:Transposase MuDR plant domain-containing protein n=1 Tax=Hevea brasiliensis TaxID=3981 RepID=A0A6A6LHC5_HEVBR|nr:hypothetical protein GH714_005949 [Hevea brasiliensis]
MGVQDEISFSLCIHHNGTLREQGYYDGKTWTIHGLTWDTMSMVRIDRMCQGLKIKGMLRQAEIEGIIDLYVQHLIVDDLRKEFRLQEVTKKSKLILKEIDEIGVVVKESGDNSYKDTITNNDRLHTSANGNDIVEDIIRHDNEIQMPNARGDGIGQRVIGLRLNLNMILIQRKYKRQRVTSQGLDRDIQDDRNDDQSDYTPSDELLTDIGEDDDCYRFPDFNAKNDMKDPTFEIGMLFKNKDEFKEACRAYGINHIFQIHFPRNEVRD